MVRVSTHITNNLSNMLNTPTNKFLNLFKTHSDRKISLENSSQTGNNNGSYACESCL